MAAGEGSSEPEEDDQSESKNGEAPTTGSNAAAGEDSGEDDEEEEPRLKYAPLTKSLSSLYRNGDASSTFFVAGDKMVRFVLVEDGRIDLLLT